MFAHHECHLLQLRPEANFIDVLGPPIPRGAWKSNQDSAPDLSTFAFKSTEDALSSRRSSISQTTSLPSGSSFIGGSSGSRDRQSRSSAEDDDSCSSEREFDFADFPGRRLPVRGASHPPGSPGEDFLMQEYLNVNVEKSFRFHGKSSPFPLVQATRRFMRSSKGKEDGFHDMSTGSGVSWSDAGRVGIGNIPKRRRDMFWTLSPWEEAWEHKRSLLTFSSSHPPFSHEQPEFNPVHDFPPSDLTLPLLSLYFHHTNAIFPLLHAPTFYAQFRDGLHLRDMQFAGVVWALLAIGARWSQDRRVLWDGWGAEARKEPPECETSDEKDVEWASAGWRFFLRSLDGSSFPVTSLNAPSLFELQFCCLGAMFLRGSSVHTAGWVVNGTGLRKAMDVGAHRNKVYSPNPSVENELWKRAFWMLVLFDRIGSAGLGRPCCVREEDFDLDFPLEVDDEYWIPTDPTQPAFKQPAGKPSFVSCLVCVLKLTQIMAHALRTIYCIDKSKVLLGLVSDDWQAQIVSQLNTALDEWVETVPEHLRWSPSIKDDLFANQSATIYATYYLTLILIYRPFSHASAFLPQKDAPARPAAPSTFPFPADSICTNAAHSAIRIIDIQARRGFSNIPNMVSVAQLCAVTQLMSLHSEKAVRSDEAVTSEAQAARVRERERITQDIAKCIQCLELVESRWIMARRFLSSFRASLPDPDCDLDSETDPYASRQQMDYEPFPEPPSAQEALTDRANWRWFQVNPSFAQQRISKRQQGDTIRHHIPQVVLSSHLAPQPQPIALNTPAVHASPYVGHNDIVRRLSVTSRPGNMLPPVVPDQPISSTSRAVRASASGQFLSVATPQSAARDDFGVGGRRGSAPAMSVPQHPYATLHQTPPQAYNSR
ncbi:fungal-specific transcription factor domain-containing protein [Phellopilus nigrolimitatus]|nr:fungal-specific transcription factor domain-containing protein [Phellopilus nigrolimitatus]